MGKSDLVVRSKLNPKTPSLIYHHAEALSEWLRNNKWTITLVWSRADAFPRNVGPTCLGNGKTCSTYTTTFPTGVASCEWTLRGGAALEELFSACVGFFAKFNLRRSSNVSRTAELILSVSQGCREAPSEHDHGAVLLQSCQLRQKATGISESLELYTASPRFDCRSKSPCIAPGTMIAFRRR